MRIFGWRDYNLRFFEWFGLMIHDRWPDILVALFLAASIPIVVLGFVLTYIEIVGCLIQMWRANG
jgi:hypothetical protein